MSRLKTLHHVSVLEWKNICGNLKRLGEINDFTHGDEIATLIKKALEMSSDCKALTLSI